MRFSDLAGGLGFGRDRDGDHRRREEQGVVELSDGATVAGVDPAWTELGHLTPESDAALREAISRAIGTDLRRRAHAIQQEARAMTPDPPVSDDDPEVPGHRLTREHHGQATVVRCECGRWDGGWLGPRSRRRVLDDHAAHVAAELSATGPLIVHSERADQPREINP